MINICKLKWEDIRTHYIYIFLRHYLQFYGREMSSCLIYVKVQNQNVHS